MRVLRSEHLPFKKCKIVGTVLSNYPIGLLLVVVYRESTYVSTHAYVLLCWLLSSKIGR